MSALVLVRHGQASFFAHDYDQLSPLGRRQARLLGEHWAHRGVVFDAIFAGPRIRQRHTAELTAEAYQTESGRSWPTIVTLDELDEYDLSGLLQRLAPALAGERAAFAGLVQRYQASRDDDERARHFQKMFEALVLHWQEASAPLGSLDVEPWSEFHERVHRGIGRLVATPGHGARVAAFTSGGFIGAAIQMALDAPQRTALELSWRLRNASLTDFVFSPGRFTLDGFNNVSYIEDPELLTYR
jgi:broad specificity phosphatase PhoE